MSWVIPSKNVKWRQPTNECLSIEIRISIYDIAALFFAKPP